MVNSIVFVTLWSVEKVANLVRLSENIIISRSFNYNKIVYVQNMLVRRLKGRKTRPLYHIKLITRI